MSRIRSIGTFSGPYRSSRSVRCLGYRVRSWIGAFEVPSLIPVSRPYPLLHEVKEQPGNGEDPIDHGRDYVRAFLPMCDLGHSAARSACRLAADRFLCT